MVQENEKVLNSEIKRVSFLMMWLFFFQVFEMFNRPWLSFAQLPLDEADERIYNYKIFYSLYPWLKRVNLKNRCLTLTITL